MFVRVKKDADRGRFRVQIVQSVRDGGRVRQKVVRHVGIGRSEAEVEALKGLAKTIMEGILESSAPRRRELFGPRETEGMLALARGSARPGRLGVDLAECREESRMSLGVREALGAVYSQLGWDGLLGARRRSACGVVRELALARLSQPRSKRGTVADLSRDTGATLNLDWVYRAMDLVDGRVEGRIRSDSRRAAERLFGGPLDVLFHDCTTLYFESQAEEEPSEGGLRRKGWSKDGKPHRSQVVLALLVTAEGLPVDYGLFPGNTAEVGTLSAALDALAGSGPPGGVTVVADAAMLSGDNRTMLRGRGLPHILGFRHRSARAALRERILDPDGWAPWGGIGPAPNPGAKPAHMLKVLEHGGDRLVVSWSAKRARKDARDRERALRRLRARLGKKGGPASVSNRGYARFLDFPKDGTVAVSAGKVAADARWDGIRSILAHGNAHLGPEELLGHYHGLWEVEHCFRTNKHDLRVRPVFHWKPERVRAHIAICYMAFCCLQHLRLRLRRLGRPMSPEALRRELNALQLSVLAREGTGEKYGLPSRATAAARRIYKCVGLAWDERPFRIPDRKGRPRKPTV